MFDVVIPTIGRDSLHELLRSLASSRGPAPHRVIVVDDRKNASTPLTFDRIEPAFRERISVLRGRASGPAAARNAGWRAASADFIAFLDDDVVVGDGWLAQAAADIADMHDSDAGSQGRVRVPLPQGRRATDWERNVAGLQHSQWITADMIYRRSMLERLGGFDERFRRAYREDADFALRVFDAGFSIAKGTRPSMHPVRPAGPWISVRLQAGNADDVRMAAIHGAAWRRRAGASNGRWPLHVASVVAFAAWLGLTAEFAWRRIAPGPRTLSEIATMAATSAVIPFAAVYHRLRGAFSP